MSRDTLRTGWGAGSGGSPSGIGPVVLASTYGADPTGTTDSGPAINSAIAALPTSGGTVYIGPGNFKISTTIQIGNGSQSQISTTTGIVLVGSAGPAGVGVLTSVPAPDGQYSPCRLFSGAAVDMVHVNGPLEGWGVHNIEFDGASLGLIGLHEIACQGGDSSGCIIKDFVTCGQQTNSLFQTGALALIAPNHMHNRYNNFAVQVPYINNAIGIMCDGNGTDGTTDSSFDQWDHLIVRFAAAASTGVSFFGIYLKCCDAQLFDNVEFYGIAKSGSGYCGAVEFDYTLVNHFPWDCVINKVDFATTLTTVANNGSPNPGTQNTIMMIASENSQPLNPSIPGLNWIPLPASSTLFGSAVVTSPTVTSGTAFTPSATRDTTVYIQTSSVAAGTITVTMGPTTGAENSIISAQATLANATDNVTLRVPNSWLVVITLTGAGAAITKTTVVTC